MKDRTDAELVDRGRAGDTDAIGELFSRYWRAARAAAFGVTGEIASAEDAAAEGLRQALARLGALRDPARFGSWLRTIVIRTARTERRSRGGDADASAVDIAAAGERQDAALERLEDAALVQHAVSTLPAALREAIALVYFEGYGQESAARFLGVPPGTLRRRLHDGRHQLRVVVEDMLRGRTSVRDNQHDSLAALMRLLEDGDDYGALRGALALRPVPREVLDLIVRQAASRGPAEAPHRGDAAPQLAWSKEARAAMSALASPSAHALDPGRPVGATALAIRQALPDFQDWNIDPGAAAERLFTLTASAEDRWRAMLPPGFADGQPGAYARASRGVLNMTRDERPQSMYELLQESDSPEKLRAAASRIFMTDVIDLVWMRSGPLDLRSVQDLLEHLGSAVLPGTHFRFSPYDEPRYRAALQLHGNGVAARLASGGVLAPWPGQPEGAEAAHVRLFLEPWTAIRLGGSS